MTIKDVAAEVKQEESDKKRWSWRRRKANTDKYMSDAKMLNYFTRLVQNFKGQTISLSHYVQVKGQ